MSTNAAERAAAPELTGALEDYLSTIYELLRDQKVARVRDIALARGVKAGSVSPALKRLASMGLVEYAQREYITLTTEGELAARRVRARHLVIIRFLREVMGVTEAQAAEDACALEHNLSDESMDRMVRFFEFLSACPNATGDFLERFHGCALVHDDVTACPHHGGEDETCVDSDDVEPDSLFELQPGQAGLVTQVNAVGPLRHQLLDMGILPGTRVVVERVAQGEHRVRVRLQRTALDLTRSEARVVVVRRLTGAAHSYPRSSRIATTRSSRRSFSGCTCSKRPPSCSRSLRRPCWSPLCGFSATGRRMARWDRRMAELFMNS